MTSWYCFGEDVVADTGGGVLRSGVSKKFLPPTQIEMGFGIGFILGGGSEERERHKNERRDFELEGGGVKWKSSLSIFSEEKLAVEDGNGDENKDKDGDTESIDKGEPFHGNFTVASRSFHGLFTVFSRSFHSNSLKSLEINQTHSNSLNLAQTYQFIAARSIQMMHQCYHRLHPI